MSERAKILDRFENAIPEFTNEMKGNERSVKEWKSMAIAMADEIISLQSQLTALTKENARLKKGMGLLEEALAWIDNSDEPAPSLCADIRKLIIEHNDTRKPRHD